jgi:hypothetical protein
MWPAPTIRRTKQQLDKIQSRRTDVLTASSFGTKEAKARQDAARLQQQVDSRKQPTDQEISMHSNAKPNMSVAPEISEPKSLKETGIMFSGREFAKTLQLTYKNKSGNISYYFSFFFNLNKTNSANDFVKNVATKLELGKVQVNTELTGNGFYIAYQGNPYNNDAIIFKSNGFYIFLFNYNQGADINPIAVKESNLFFKTLPKPFAKFNTTDENLIEEIHITNQQQQTLADKKNAEEEERLRMERNKKAKERDFTGVWGGGSPARQLTQRRRYPTLKGKVSNRHRRSRRIRM